MTYKDTAFKTLASQDKFELWTLLELLGGRTVQSVLEVGIDKGYLCQTWREAFPVADVVGIDNNPEALVFRDFHFIEGDSQDPATRDVLLQEGYTLFDLIFIDGDHSYRGVRKDYELYGPLIRPGGIIAFHDITRTLEEFPGIEVRRFFDELKKKHASVEIVNPHNGPGIGCIFL